MESRKELVERQSEKLSKKTNITPSFMHAPQKAMSP